MNREKWIAVAVGLGLMIFFLFGPQLLGLFESSSKPTGSTETLDIINMENTNNTNTNSQNNTEELQAQDVVVGEGEEAVPGSVVTVNYTGWFENGQKFDSSFDRNEPFKFVLGQGQVIRGWDLGVAGMKVGGKRRLIIPASLGYGPAGVDGAIPPNAVLLFEVELLDVSKPL